MSIQPDSPKIRELREDRGWDRADLAEKAGLSERTIDTAEEDGRINASTLYKIALALGVETRTLRRPTRESPPTDSENTLLDGVAAEHPRTATKPIPSKSPSTAARADYWGDAPDGVTLHGRRREVDDINLACTKHHCRVVGLFGKGGIGKTAIAAKVARDVANEFQAVYWRDLKNSPPVAEVLQHCLYVLSDFQSVSKSVSPDVLADELIAQLRRRRVLLVLDNLESVMEAGSGQFRLGYAEYGFVIRKLGHMRHSSCVLLTSREKPSDWAFFETEGFSVSEHKILPLDFTAAELVLRDKGLTGPRNLMRKLARSYDGNPGYLKIVGALIRKVHAGNVEPFLREHNKLPKRIEVMLEEQVSRLSEYGLEVLYWLAIRREPCAINILKADLLTNKSQRELANAIDSLVDHDLIVSTKNGFTIENLLLEYLTDRFVTELSGDLVRQSFNRLNGHPILLAHAKEYIRAAQYRLIAQPICDHLLESLGTSSEAERGIRELLNRLQTERRHAEGYAAGNLINILCCLGASLAGANLSHLVIRQADFREASLRGASLRESRLVRCAFLESFSGVLTVTVSPNGELLATGDARGEVIVRRIDDQQILVRERLHDSWVRCVAFDPSGQILATAGDDQSVQLWSLASSSILRTLHGHRSRVRSIAWNRDADTIATSSDDDTIRLWGVNTGQVKTILSGHTGHVRSIAFLTSDRLVSGSEDGTVRLWNVNSGSCEHVMRGHTGAVCAVAASPDGSSIASGGDDKTLRLWSSEGKAVSTLVGHTGWIWSLAYSLDGSKLASGGGDRTTRIWDLKTGRCLRVLLGHGHWVRSVAFSSDGTAVVTGSDDRTIRIWDIDSGDCLRILQGHSAPIWSLAFSPDGKTLASSGNDHAIRLWNLQSRSITKVLPGHESWIWTVAFSRDGKLLGSASGDLTARIWSMDQPAPPVVLRGHGSQVRAVAFDPRGRFIATGSDDRTVRLWDVGGRCLEVLEGHSSQVWAVAINPDGTVLASASDDCTIRLWDITSGSTVRVLSGHTNRVLSVAFSSDGMRLASGSEDRTARVWTLNSDACLVLSGHTNWVQSVVFCRGDTVLASGSDDKTIILWDVASGQHLHTITGHADWVRTVAASPDGELLASGSQDGIINLWDMRTCSNDASLRISRVYEGLDITNTRGLTGAEVDNLVALGAGYSEVANQH